MSTTSKTQKLISQLNIKKTVLSILNGQIESLKAEIEALRTQNEALIVSNLHKDKEIRRIAAQYEYMAGEMAKMQPWWRWQDDETEHRVRVTVDDMKLDDVPF